MTTVVQYWRDHLNMKHTTNQRLFAYWNDVRNNRRAPRRYEIEPLRITSLLPETFITEFESPGMHKFRLAGARACQFFCRELKGQNFLDLWSDQDKRAIEALLTKISDEACVGLVTYKAQTANYRETQFEMLLLPLRHTSTSVDRILGSVSTYESQIWYSVNAPLQVSVVTVNIYYPNQTNTNILSPLN